MSIAPVVEILAWAAVGWALGRLFGWLMDRAEVAHLRKMQQVYPDLADYIEQHLLTRHRPNR